MSNLTATKDTWSCLNTKRDLFKIFNEVDQNVIEMVIESRDNNCKFYILLHYIICPLLLFLFYFILVYYLNVM